MKIILLVILFISTYSLAQEISYEKVKKEFDDFKYDSVIKLSDQLIAQNNLSDSLKIEVYIMRAIIFYERDEKATRKAFENILEIKKNYVPNPFYLSPALIAIFNDVKSEYYRKNPEPIQPGDSTQVKQEVKFIDPIIVKNTIIKNLVLPGLGQIQLGSPVRGWITASAFTISFGAMIYTILDTKKKEDAYLNESNEFLIQQKYDSYNQSYKIRNVLILSCAAIWIYSQLDFLFFSENLDLNYSSSSISLKNSSIPRADLVINLKIPF